MAVVTVKDKNAVFVAASVMRKARMERGIEEGLNDLKQGQVYGPYASVAAAKKAFDDRTRLTKT
jgi:hypothetical protein